MDFEGLADLRADDFELFGFPKRYALDATQLDTRWKALQRQAHPDRHAGQSATQQRTAMQWSVRINEAYRRLKNPLQRAAYLCELHGAPVRAQDNTAMPADFLLQQIQWHEALEVASTPEDLDQIGREVLSVKRDMLQKCEQLLDDQCAPEQAASLVRALMFIERLALEVQSRRAAVAP